MATTVYNPETGGSDVIPVTYSYASATMQWQPADPLTEQGFYLSRCVYSQSFAPLQVTGNSSEIVNQQATYGLVPMTIVQANLGMRGAPAYCDVVYNGVQYKIQIGAVATVPTIVRDLINASGDYRAV